jgi:hypothetical protein
LKKITLENLVRKKVALQDFLLLLDYLFKRPRHIRKSQESFDQQLLVASIFQDFLRNNL